MIQPASGRLLGLVSSDLPGHRLMSRPDGLASLVPETAAGPELVVGSRVKKRFLGRTEIGVFQTVMAAPGRKQALLRVVQSGAMRRRGVEVRVVEGSDDATDIADALTRDLEFASAAATLDFTRFELEIDGGQCTATVELMGATHVAIALPPIRSYVRLHADQREALLACFAALGEVITR